VSKRKKKRPEIKYADVELNIVPFIDVFSMLNTFLLMTAVFTSIGIIEVQIPFLTTAPPEHKDTDRVLEVKVDMEKDQVEVSSVWSQPPLNEQKKTFKVNKKDIADLHKFMVEIKKTSPEAEKVSFFTEDDVLFNDIASVLDAVKLRLPTDPVFATKAAPTKPDSQEFLFPKVTMSSVML
jgi:biopolymer transport protein ExbD